MTQLWGKGIPLAELPDFCTYWRPTNNFAASVFFFFFLGSSEEGPMGNTGLNSRRLQGRNHHNHYRGFIVRYNSVSCMNYNWQAETRDLKRNLKVKMSGNKRLESFIVFTSRSKTYQTFLKSPTFEMQMFTCIIRPLINMHPAVYKQRWLIG